MATPSTLSPSRPALSIKSTNASLLPRVSNYSLKPLISPARTTTRVISVEYADGQGQSSPRAGQKRKLDALNDLEAVQLQRGDGPGKVMALAVRRPAETDKLQRVASGLRDVDRDVDVEMESESEGDGETVAPSSSSSPCQAMAMDATRTLSSTQESKAVSSSLLTSFHASQEGPVPLEEQFQIHEETSQRTLDSLVSIQSMEIHP